MIELLDVDGDGEVDLTEFMSGLPDTIKQMIEDKIPMEPLASIQKAIRRDVDAVALNLWGAGERLKLSVSPPSIALPTSLTVGVPFTLPLALTVANDTAAHARWRWAPALLTCRDGAAPDFFERDVDPDSDVLVEVRFRNDVCHVRGLLPFHNERNRREVRER